MAAYARTPSALTWLRVNHLINGLHKQISCKNCLYAVNLYFTLASYMRCKWLPELVHSYAYLYAKQKHPGCKKRRGQSEAAVIK